MVWDGWRWEGFGLVSERTVRWREGEELRKLREGEMLIKSWESERCEKECKMFYQFFKCKISYNFCLWLKIFYICPIILLQNKHDKIWKYFPENISHQNKVLRVKTFKSFIPLNRLGGSVCEHGSCKSSSLGYSKPRCLFKLFINHILFFVFLGEI